MPDSPSTRAGITRARKGGLALLRLRLRLALLTMAIVPVAITLALVYAVVGSQGFDVRAHVSTDSSAVSAAIASQVQRTEGMLQVLAAEPTLLRAIGDPSAIDRARDTLQTLTLTSANLIPEARLAGSDGRVRLHLVDGGVRAAFSDNSRLDPALMKATLALPPGTVYRTLSYRAASGEMRITLAMRLGTASSVNPQGVLSFEVALPELVASVGPRLQREGAFALLVESGTGLVLADTRDPAGDPQAWRPGPQGLEPMLHDILKGSDGAWQALLSEGWATGTAPIGADPSSSTWSVVVLQPTVPPVFPTELVVALAALAMLVVGLTVWMSRQILRPAEMIETSRTELKRMYEEAREDALRDALTGLGNHRAFQEELERQVDWYKRYRVPVSLLLIDLDDLKLTNDSEGHAAGDALLRHMGQLLTEVVRYSDRAFRIGGDEFAVLMPHTDAAAAQQVGRRLMKRASEPPDGSRPVPFSGGISACPELATTRQQLYTQADAALYWCKRHGRNSIDVFQTGRDARRDGEVTPPDELAARVARVASERPLRAVFQPIVSLADGSIMGYEGLIRPTEGAGFPDPGALFAAADAVGRTVELDAACFAVVAAAARRIPADKSISVNLSPRTVEASDFGAEDILRPLADLGIPPSRLIVELTERDTVQDLARLRRNLADLQQAGVRIAADDVGAGNAGLRLLSQFRFDIVKIDLSLVQEGAQRDSSKAVLRSLRDLAGRWGAFVIAEGLETPEQLRMVRELGLGAGQGYLLGRPGTNIELPSINLDELEAGVLLLQNANARSSAA